MKDVIVLDSYLILRMNVFIDSFGEAMLFSILDANSGH